MGLLGLFQYKDHLSRHRDHIDKMVFGHINIFKDNSCSGKIALNGTISVL